MSSIAFAGGFPGNLPLDALAALPLIALLWLGRSSRRRQLLGVAAGAVVATIAYGILYLLTLGIGALPEDLAFTAAAILTLASWAVLLYTAGQSGKGGWLVAVAVALAITLGLPLLLALPLGPVLHILLPALSPAVALLLAGFLPLRPRLSSPDF